MPASVFHVATATSPDIPGVEINSTQWNSGHAFTLNASGSEISGAFSNAGGVSWGLDGGGRLTATVRTDYQSAGAYLTTAMASNRGSDFVAATAAFAGTSASGTIASNGISISIGPYITTAMLSNRGSDFVQATAAFAGTSASGTIASNGISVSIGPYITTGMLSNRGSDFVQATAAFAGTNASGTIASNGISVSVAAPGGGGGTGSIYFTGNTTQNSSSTQNYSSVLFGGNGAASVGVSNGSIQVSVPNTSSLVGTGGISLSSNGSTISISNTPIAMFEPLPLLQSGSTTFAPVAGSWYFQPVYIEQPISGGRWNIMIAHGSTASNFRATTANYVSSSTGTLSITGSYGRNLAMYSLGAGTNSTRLESFWSNAWPLSFTHVVQVASAAGPNMTVSQSIVLSGITSINSQGSTTQGATTFNGNANAANSSIGSTALTTVATGANNFVSSQLMIPIPFNTTINPGAYWLAHMWLSTSGSSSTGTNIASTAVNTLSVVNQYGLYGNTNTAARAWLQTAATSGSQPFPGVGVYSASSAAPPTTAAFSDVRTFASQILPYINYVNSTLS